MDEYSNMFDDTSENTDLSSMTMPFSNEAEQSVLGAMIINSDVIPEVIGIINAKNFYIKRHEILFDTVIDMFNRGIGINFVLIKEQLEKRGVYDEVGGLEFVLRLTDLVPSTESESVKHYARIIREKSELRRMIELTDNVRKRCFAGEEDVDDIIEAAEQGIINITKNRNATGLTHISAYLDESVKRIEELGQQDNDITGLTTGFTDLDKRTAGLHPAELILIAARPGMGKSALALNIAQNAALLANATVAIFSLEMPGIQIANRMLSSQTKIPAEQIKRGDLKDSDWNKMGEAMSALVSTKLYIDDNPTVSAMDISAKCRKLKIEKGLDLVIVDYLQLMSSGKNSGNRQEEVSQISRMLKVLANDLQIPVIALSQLNRSVEKRDVKEPVLSDLRESGSIEQDADMVIFLYREGYYVEDCEQPNKTKIKFEKHRNGEVGYEYLTWLGEYTKFANWSGIRD